MSALAPTLQAFFTDRLIAQRHASPHTIAAYRDTLRLLLGFAEGQIGKEASKLEIGDLDAPLIAAFLHHLEHERHNSARTRNARLAAVHSLFRYAALRHPEHAALIERVLAIPPKRCDRALISFLDEAEVDALLESPDRSTWTGRRDHTLVLLAVQTGLRASELTGLSCGDVHLGSGAHVSCLGKGRKQRITPLLRETVATLAVWLRERGGHAADPLFPTSRGASLSRDALERRLAKHKTTALRAGPSLASKRVTLHVLRHTAAMRLLHAAVDTSVIALWLGHARVDTTHVYLNADLASKEKALARTAPPNSSPGRYRPRDPILAFLESLGPGARLALASSRRQERRDLPRPLRHHDDGSSSAALAEKIDLSVQLARAGSPGRFSGYRGIAATPKAGSRAAAARDLRPAMRIALLARH